MSLQKPKIPNFTIIELCGQGGSSTVWLAIDADGIRRAIRIMDIVDDESKERIEAENKAIALYRNIANQHKNLLDILYIGKTSKYLYYVTELADNVASFECKYQADTLAYRIIAKKYSKSEILDYVEAILHGTEQLHRNHIAHYDLKPENILFVRGYLKIADPGLSSSIKTVPHAGTNGFFPPWDGASGVDADIYAIGKIIYCLYTRSNADEFPEIPENVDIIRFADLNDIALRCCENDPELRYKSIAEIRADVMKIRTQPGWKEFLTRQKGGLSWLLGILLMISLVFHLYPLFLERMKYLSEKEGNKILAQVQENITHLNIVQSFKTLEYLNRYCPELASQKRFRDFYVQIRDNIEWLNCYRSSENTVLTLPIILNLGIYPTTKEREAIVQRYILMNPATLKMPSVMYQYYLFAKKIGDQEKAQKILDMIKDIEITVHNRITIALVYISLSNQLAIEKDYKNARFFAERAQEMAPQLFGVYIMQFQAYYSLGDYEKALEALRKLYKLQPDSICIERFYSLLIEKGLDFTL